VGGQTRCRSGRRLHQRVIRHRRLTLHVSLSFIFATPFTSTNFATKPCVALSYRTEWSRPIIGSSRALRPNTSSDWLPVLHRPLATDAADIIFTAIRWTEGPYPNTSRSSPRIWNHSLQGSHS
jgi:hypothetical protein